MKAILRDKSFQLSILLTTIFIGTGIAFLFLGLVDYSWILFILLPVVLGIALGTMMVRKYALQGAVLTTVLLLIGLYVPGLSGVICIVMAIGLVVPFIFYSQNLSSQSYKSALSEDVGATILDWMGFKDDQRAGKILF